MENLKKTLINAVEREVGAEKQVALFFSGGLDSAVVGKILIDNGITVIPITVGEEKSEDVLTSKIITKKLFKKYIVIDINKKTVEETIPKIIGLTGKKDTITVSVGCVIYLAAKYASMLGLKTIFTGAGSDEIFAGYSSHEKALEKGFDAVQEECEKRLKEVTNDIERDKKICEHFGLDVKTPFLDKKVVEIAMKIDPKLKISKTEKKIILRKIAKELGLPKEVYERKKRAAQYGSGIQKIIKKISKEKGYKSIGEYLNNVYKK